jgi:hypothetical protein
MYRWVTAPPAVARFFSIGAMRIRFRRSSRPIRPGAKRRGKAGAERGRSDTAVGSGGPWLSVAVPAALRRDHAHDRGCVDDPLDSLRPHHLQQGTPAGGSRVAVQVSGLVGASGASLPGAARLALPAA